MVLQIVRCGKYTFSMFNPRCLTKELFKWKSGEKEGERKGKREGNGKKRERERGMKRREREGR